MHGKYRYTVAPGTYILSAEEAAQLLNSLGLCKAFGSQRKSVGINCYRFGHRDMTSGTWWWSIAELISMARDKGVASPEAIAAVTA